MLCNEIFYTVLFELKRRKISKGVCLGVLSPISQFYQILGIQTLDFLAPILLHTFFCQSKPLILLKPSIIIARSRQQRLTVNILLNIQTAGCEPTLFQFP